MRDLGALARPEAGYPSIILRMVPVTRTSLERMSSGSITALHCPFHSLKPTRILLHHGHTIREKHYETLCD